jgi:hypothetical protein
VETPAKTTPLVRRHQQKLKPLIRRQQ